MTMYKTIVQADGSMSFVEMTPDEVQAEIERGERERLATIAAKGHDCWEHPDHRLFRSSRGGMQDAYYCGICHDLLQVG